MSESKTVQIRDMDPQLWKRVRIRAAQLDLSIKDYAARVFEADCDKGTDGPVNPPNEVRPA